MRQRIWHYASAGCAAFGIKSEVRSRLVLMVVMLGLSGCGDWTTMAMSLSNGSGQLLSDVSANFAGEIRTVDRVVPGQFISLVSHAGGEGMICLTYRQGGIMQYYPIGYMTKNMPTHYRITVRNGYVLVTNSGFFDYSVPEGRIHRPLPPDKKCPR
jgi:hypothetical protein